MSARPPATRVGIEFSGGFFVCYVFGRIAPLEGSATKAKPAKAGDAKPRGYRTSLACQASRAAEPLREGVSYVFTHDVADPDSPYRGRGLRHQTGPDGYRL